MLCSAGDVICIGKDIQVRIIDVRGDDVVFDIEHSGSFDVRIECQQDSRLSAEGFEVSSHAPVECLADAL